MDTTLNVIFEDNKPVSAEQHFECTICQQKKKLSDGIISVVECGSSVEEESKQYPNLIIQVDIICKLCAAEHAKSEGY
jgi:hypothetical protein